MLYAKKKIKKNCPVFKIRLSNYTTQLLMNRLQKLGTCIISGSSYSRYPPFFFFPPSRIVGLKTEQTRYKKRF